MYQFYLIREPLRSYLELFLIAILGLLVPLLYVPKIENRIENEISGCAMNGIIKNEVVIDSSRVEI